MRKRKAAKFRPQMVSKAGAVIAWLSSTFSGNLGTCIPLSLSVKDLASCYLLWFNILTISVKTLGGFGATAASRRHDTPASWFEDYHYEPQCSTSLGTFRGFKISWLPPYASRLLARKNRGTSDISKQNSPSVLRAKLFWPSPRPYWQATCRPLQRLYN